MRDLDDASRRRVREGLLELRGPPDLRVSRVIRAWRDFQGPRELREIPDFKDQGGIKEIEGGWVTPGTRV